MKIALIALPCLAVLALAACSPAPAPDPAAPLDQPQSMDDNAQADDQPRLDASAVFNGEFSGCRGKRATPLDRCLPEQLRTLGASPAAIAAAQELVEQGTPGYVSDWQQIEGIGVASITYPLRANTNEGTRLVDSTGRWIDVDADPLPAADRQREPVSSWLRAHPKANPVAPAQAEGSRGGEEGGVELVYASDMRDCRACATYGTVRIAYQFDKQRRYVGQRVLELR